MTEQITTSQRTYIDDIAWMLDTKWDEDTVRYAAKGALAGHSSRCTGCDAHEYAARKDAARAELTGRELSAAIKAIEADFGDAMIAARHARNAEARTLYARIDELTKAEASHLIDLINAR